MQILAAVLITGSLGAKNSFGFGGNDEILVSGASSLGANGVYKKIHFWEGCDRDELLDLANYLNRSICGKYYYCQTHDASGQPTSSESCYRIKSRASQTPDHLKAKAHPYFWSWHLIGPNGDELHIPTGEPTYFAPVNLSDYEQQMMGIADPLRSETTPCITEAQNMTIRRAAEPRNDHNADPDSEQKDDESDGRSESEKKLQMDATPNYRTSGEVSEPRNADPDSEQKDDESDVTSESEKKLQMDATPNYRTSGEVSEPRNADPNVEDRVQQLMDERPDLYHELEMAYQGLSSDEPLDHHRDVYEWFHRWVHGDTDFSYFPKNGTSESEKKLQMDATPNYRTSGEVSEPRNADPDSEQKDDELDGTSESEKKMQMDATPKTRGGPKRELQPPSVDSRSETDDESGESDSDQTKKGSDKGCCIIS